MKTRQNANHSKKSFRVDTIGGRKGCQTSEMRGLAACAFDLLWLIFYTE
jgi:hypothetical protein